MYFSAATCYRVRVPPRCDAQRVELRGLFPGALVTRGRDWRWGNQDGELMPTDVYLSFKWYEACYMYILLLTNTGGVGKFGKIMSIREWSNETAVSNSTMEWL